MSILGKIKQFLGSLFDIRDIFVFGGLGLIWYGLHLFLPWVAWTASGIILMLIGLFFGRPAK